MNYEAQFVRLRIYNVFMGFLHLAQAVAIFILSNDFTLPITTSLLSFIPETGKLWPVTDTVINLPLGPMVAIFLLLSAVAHFTIASPNVFGWYLNNLNKGINYARWYEYAFSASLMIVLIGMLCGLYDLAAGREPAGGVGDGVDRGQRPPASAGGPSYRDGDETGGV